MRVMFKNSMVGPGPEAYLFNSWTSTFIDRHPTDIGLKTTKHLVLYMRLGIQREMTQNFVSYVLWPTTWKYTIITHNRQEIVMKLSNP